ncbi:TPA: MurR/RpiR family transcriptional regulator [Klebsiella aerogenes]|nr:MurR/RpiR family transcriptional regulator [Klebsiella aerogenes]
MAYSIDIISCITDRFMALTATEKRIAQFILDDVAAAAEMPIAELARLTDTSQASVTRFARALGCKDVRELKMKLAQSLAIGQRFILDVPDLEGVQGIYESIISVLETNRRALDLAALKRAVEWISDARQVLALGMGGGSTICAQEIQYRLFRLGLPVVSQSDGLLVRMMSSAVTAKDVVIVLSLGGYTKEMIESAAIARQYGAKIVAITPPETPLAAQADIVLPLLVSENDYIFKPSASRYAMLAMVDVLATELAMANKPQAKDRLRRIKLALDDHRDGVDRLPPAAINRRRRR